MSHNFDTSFDLQDVAVVGATGLVGLEIQKILNEAPFKQSYRPVLFASQAKAELGVLELKSNLECLQRCSFVLNGANDDVAEFLAAQLGEHQVLIDNSSRFRMDPSVPLVVPEINGELLKAQPQIVANPNCTAILLCLTLHSFSDIGITRVIVSTYQAASGAGIKGLEELESQFEALGQKKPMPKPVVFPFVLAGNLFSHNSAVRGSNISGEGYCEEEWKVVEETRKILNIRHLAISATCVRVPIRRAHTEAVTVDLKEELSLADIQKRLAQTSGVLIVNDSEKNHFPMPLEAENQNLVLVGRIRKDVTLGKTFHYLLAGDQIRKGAALNAVQIMDQIRKLKD